MNEFLILSSKVYSDWYIIKRNGFKIKNMIIYENFNLVPIYLRFMDVLILAIKKLSLN